MHSCISRIIIHHPNLLRKFTETNNDICEYIYEDPFCMLESIDLKQKFLTDPECESEKYYVIRQLEEWYCIFSHLRTNPRPRLINDYYVSIAFDSKYENLRNMHVNAHTYLVSHPEYINEFLIQTMNSNDEKLIKLVEDIFFDTLIVRREGTRRGTRRGTMYISRSTDWTLPDEMKSLFSEDFLKKYEDYLKLNKEVIRDRHEYNYFYKGAREDIEFYSLEKEILDDTIDVEIQNTKVSDLPELMSIAKELIDEFGGYIGGSSALSFFNYINGYENFAPGDIDFFIEDAVKYKQFIEKYGVTELKITSGYEMDMNIDCVVYAYYKNKIINLILVNVPIKAHVSSFDFEFCQLLWNGKNFDESSHIALASAKNRKSYFNIGGYRLFSYERYSKYKNRKYEIILYNDA